MNEKEYYEIQVQSKKYKYSYPFNHMDYCDFDNAHILVHTDTLILIADKENTHNNIYWSFDDTTEFLSSLENLSGKITVDFVPNALVDTFTAHGFKISAEYIDFFNNNLPETTEFIAHNSEIELVSCEDKEAFRQMSLLCVEQSRGFFYESEEWYMDWARENDILAVRHAGNIIGYCCVSIYGNNTVVWVRRLAVAPEWQGKGIGEGLLRQALVYGFQKGAHRAFLHVDSSNESAILLYRKFSFSAVGDEGQIIMQR